MQPAFFIRSEVRSLPSAEGTVLLDLRSGKYFALNSTGSFVWSRLEAGAGREEIEQALRETFGAAGEVEADLEALFAGLEGRGLIEREGNVETPRGASLHWGVAAFATLLLTDLALKACGFPRCSRFLARAVRAAGPADPERVARICHCVDAASRFYFKRTWCLQRSMAATLLLRLAGQPADLVIGVRRLPFLAHAWVEVEGRVVNDDPRVKPTFPEMARC
jgi:hypothetical protein